jgi:4-amino-4-deoxy-L-arabinose transferase-like glycosyltransferase
MQRPLSLRGLPPPGAAAERAAVRWDRLRALAARPAARQLALAACYGTAGIAVTWPRAAYLAGRLPASNDVSSYVWDLWWVARQMTHLGNPWFTGYMAAPAGVQLGFDTTMPLAGLVMAPVTLAFGPAASLALLTALVPSAACYAAYRAARLWLRSQAAAVASGAFFGLSTMLSFQNWYHLDVSLGAVFLPLAVEASVRLRRRPGRRQAVILGLVLGASVLVNLETAVMALALAAVVLAGWVAGAPRARAGCAGLAAVVTAAVASPQLAAVAGQAVADGVARPDVRGYVKYAAGLPGLFAPSPRLAVFGLHGLASVFQTPAPAEGVPTFGVTLSVLALLGLAAARRRRIAWLLAVAWLGSAVLALGSTLHVGGRDYVPLAVTWNGVAVSGLMPYTWLVRLPLLSGLREADRLALPGLLAAAVLAGFAAQWLLGHGGRGRALVAVAAALGMLEAGWSGNPGIGVMDSAMPALDRPIAADRSGSVVLDVPFGLRGGLGLYGTGIAAQALLLATADGHPRAVAYTAWVPGPTAHAINAHPFYRGLVAAQRHRVASAAYLAAARRDARRLRIGWVLVWPTPLRGFRRSLPVVIAYLQGTGFRFDYRADGVSVYRPSAGPGPPAQGAGR